MIAPLKFSVPGLFPFLSFKTLIQKGYQYIAMQCEQDYLCEFGENFAHLLCFYCLVS